MSAVEPFSATRLPRLVIFDLDGTLVDSVPGLTATVDSMPASFGWPPVDIGKVRQRIGNGARVPVCRALAGSIEYDGIGEEETEAVLVLFMEVYADSYAFTEVYPGVVGTLKWFKRNGMEMALITSKSERFVAPLLNEMKLGRYFRWVIGGDTLPQQKSDSAALLFVMKMVGIEPENALFVGDSHNDMLTAKTAGVCCAALTYGYNHGRPIVEEAPTLVIDSLRNLLPRTDQAAEIVLPGDSFSPSDQRDQVAAAGKFWMKVIRALARWRWHA